MRPFETLSDEAVHAMLNFSILMLDHAPKRQPVIQDIGELVVEQLMRMEDK
jgi:hypothetical protein